MNKLFDWFQDATNSLIIALVIGGCTFANKMIVMEQQGVQILEKITKMETIVEKSYSKEDAVKDFATRDKQIEKLEQRIEKIEQR